MADICLGCSATVSRGLTVLLGSRATRRQVKARIFARAGVGGLRRLKAHLRGIDRTGAGLLTRSELCEGLASFGLDVDDGPGGDVDKVMGFFDRDSEGRISIHEFHRGLRVRVAVPDLSRC